MSRANGITRQEILTSIKINGAMTAEELARKLHISQVAVRQHLASLEAERVITINVERRGLGRPSHRYRLTPQGDETFPRRYDALTQALIAGLHDWQGEEAVQALFTHTTEQAARSLKGRMKDKSLSGKVQELARIQTENGYMAEAQEGDAPGEFRLVQHNCAICLVARSFPHICCKHEIEMFEDLLDGVEIIRERYLLAGDYTCTYIIRARAEDAPRARSEDALAADAPLVQ